MFLFFSPHSKLDESLGTSPKDGKPPMEQEKRLRREIANSNERRRMQSINSGFESLKTLIPHSDGEKLSKVSSSDNVLSDDWVMYPVYVYFGSLGQGSSVLLVSHCVLVVPDVLRKEKGGDSPSCRRVFFFFTSCQ